MPDEPAKRDSEVERLADRLQERVEQERAAGAYPDDLSAIELERPSGPSLAQGFDLQSSGPRVRFRPELAFSSKPVVGPIITLVKRVLFRLQLYVFDDLARQTDTAIARVEAALAVEIATRERLERELEQRTRELEARIRQLENDRG
jgi:hypothetical protein